MGSLRAFDSATTLTVCEGYDVTKQGPYFKKRCNCCDRFHRRYTFRVWQVLLFLFATAVIIAGLALVIAMMETGKIATKHSAARETDSPDDKVIARGQDNCVFPFDYKGTTYNTCTYADHCFPWCAWDRHYQKDRWSNCVIAQGQDYCTFPFNYTGTTYNSCTYADHCCPWCAWDRHYQKDRWSNCDCSSTEEQRLNCSAHTICLPAVEGRFAQCYNEHDRR